MFVCQSGQGHVWSPKKIKKNKKKSRKLMLPLDIRVELFDRLVVRISLYGCKVRCPLTTNPEPKLQPRLSKSTNLYRLWSTWAVLAGGSGKNQECTIFGLN